MKKWEQFRHKAVFHFNPEETEIKIALQLIKSEYGYSPLFMGSEDEKIFYEKIVLAGHIKDTNK